MIRRTENEHETDPGGGAGPTDRDDRLGEAIETFLALVEGGQPPTPEAFAAGYPELGDDLPAALAGLELVQGLVGRTGGPAHRLEAGRRVAGYRIVRELGRGGMGVVYEAVHVDLDRPVALKVLGALAAPDSSGRRRFLNEARTAAGLHHTHIVPVFDVGQVGGLCYYAMQRIEGSGLDLVLRRLRRDRPSASGSVSGQRARPSLVRPASPAPAEATVSWIGSRVDAECPAAVGFAPDAPTEDDEEPAFEPPRGSAYFRWVAALGRQAAEALGHAHQRGVIHRDVKPSNLLVDARGTVWVADFGLARRLADPGQTQVDSLLGTPRYMSPEQARPGPLDGRTDVYGLGATLYELATLRPPHDGQTAAELFEQIGHREVPAPRRLDPRVPRDLETIILKCLATRPADRYAGATELADDLGRFLAHEPVRARRIGPIGRAWRFARRHPSLTAVSTSAAALVLTVAAVAYVRVARERDAAELSREATLVALDKLKAANSATRAAMRKQLWREASVVRLSSVADRRATGLRLLAEAAAMGPDAEMRANLRDEAVEFLTLRDIRGRPDLPTGPAVGLAYGPEGDRLAVLVDDGRTFALWDLEGRRLLASHPLGQGDDEPAGRPRGNGRRGSLRGSTIVAAGQFVAALRPDGRGLQLFHATTGAHLHDIAIPGHAIRSMTATPDGHRLATVERYQAEAEPDPKSPPGREGDWRVRVRLWDPERADTPLATLVDWADPDRPGPGESPLVAIAPDGRTVAVGRAGQQEITLWSVEDGRALGRIEASFGLSALALGPGGRLAAAGSGSIRLWDVDDRTLLPVAIDTRQGFITILRFNPEGTLLAAAGPRSGVELWDPSTGTGVAALAAPDGLDDLAFSPRGLTLAAAGRSSTAVWDIVAPIGRTRHGGLDAPPTSLAFRADGLLAMATLDGGLGLVTAAGVARVHTPRPVPGPPRSRDGSGPPSAGGGPPARPSTLAFDARGRLVGADPTALRIWDDPTTHADPTVLPFPWTASQGGLRFAPPLAPIGSGWELAIAQPGRILIWHGEEPGRFDVLDIPRPLGRERAGSAPSSRCKPGRSTRTTPPSRPGTPGPWPSRPTA